MTAAAGNAPLGRVEAWEEVFPLIRHRWLEVQVAGWTRGFAVAQAEYDLLCQHGLWRDPPADFFGIARISRKELQHSQMLRWLMDPKEGHGLSTTFVARMLALCSRGEAPRDLQVRSAVCEETHWTRAGVETRADIVVRGEGFTLVIENKVDAGEQPRQCDRLHECFQWTGTHFMFLSPDRDPKTDTGDPKSFKSVRYWEVSHALEEALAQAADGVAPDRAIAENYLLTLRRNFG